MRRLLLIGLLASASLAVTLATQFAPANGWHLRSTRVHACPGVPATRCSQVTSLASTMRWRDCVECLPHRTFAAMPRDGVAIQVTTAVEHPVRALHTFAWPPQIKGAQVRAGFEGLPARIGVYQASSLIERREISLFVWFGRSRPTARQLSRANSQLRRARLG